jgi:hypothetical protein
MIKSFKTFTEEGGGAGGGGAAGAGASGGTGSVAANVTGDSSTMAMPPNSGGLMRRKYKSFEVEPELFKKFQTGRMKFERWARNLDMNNEKHKAIYDYATRYRKHVVVLKDSTTGAMRAIRRRSVDGM